MYLRFIIGLIVVIASFSYLFGYAIPNYQRAQEEVRLAQIEYDKSQAELEQSFDELNASIHELNAQ